MKLQNIAISNGTHDSNGNPVFTTYTAYIDERAGKFLEIYRDDLLYHIDVNLYLRSSSNSNALTKSVREIFLAPRADLFPRPDLTNAILGSERIRYGNGQGTVTEKLIENNRLIAHAEPQNDIINILMEGLTSSAPPGDITQLNDTKRIIDYVFEKPHLLFSILLILRTEAGSQHLFRDAGNVPHRNQLILNMSSNRSSFADKLHSGTQFGIASYFHYGRRIYKSVFDLDVADYIIISISYYPTVTHGNVTYSAITNYYDSRLGDYRYSVYSFHLWRYSLYGGFAGVVGGTNYANNGYELRPECACKALRLQIDAQSQKHFKEAWYAILYFPTAFYILLLYLAMEKQNDKHDRNTIDNALKRLSQIEKEKDSPFYKKVIKRFTDELSERDFFHILKEGISFIQRTKEAVDRSRDPNYQNPLQMLWYYCKRIIVDKTHKEIIKRYRNHAPGSNKIPKLERRLDIVANYIDEKFKSIKSLYDQILQEEQKFFRDL
jgi:hypothetical protein